MPLLARHFLLTLLAIGLTPDSRLVAADDALAEATRLYQAGQWQAAADKFDRIAQRSVAVAASRQTAQLYAGECLVQLGSYSEARQRFAQLLLSNPPAKMATQAQFRLGEVAWLSGDLAEASRLLQVFVERNPLHPCAQFAQGYLDQISQRQSSQADFAILDQAVGWERDGLHDAALAAYYQLLDGQSTHDQIRAELLRRTAQLHERLDQSTEALRLYQQFLAESPHSDRTAEVLSAMAWQCIKLEQPTQAAEYFHALHEKFPESPQAAVAAYWLACRSADKQDSKQSGYFVDWLLDCEGLSDQQPQLWGKTLCLKCQLESASGQWQEVDALVQTATGQLDEGPLSAKLDFWAAEAAFRLGNYRSARELFTSLHPKTVGINEPWTAMVPLRRAQLAARRQQWSEVLELLDEMDRAYPDFELEYEVDYLRGRALAGRGEMTAARKYYQRVLESLAATDSETKTMAGWMIGETYFHQRDYPRARLAYQTVVAEATQPEWQARAALQAGKCWEMEQDWAQAASVYGKALERWPQSDSQQELASRHRWAEAQQTKMK